MNNSTFSALIQSEVSVSDWVQICSTLLLATVAFAAPYLIERWKFKYRSPKLKFKFRLAPPYCHLTQMVGVGVNFPVFYFRFLVINIGKTHADECEVFLEKIYKENRRREMVEFVNFSPVNLKWSGIRDQFKRTVYPGKEMYCDIGKVQPPGHNYQSQYRSITENQQLMNKFIFELPEIYFSQWDCLIPGRYRITISVYSKNAKKITKKFNLSWSGRWRDSEPDMFRELVIN